ncbi:hypothetical protein [Herbidospora sp. NBRC 101105]|uniref:hypothetical protein n=1 Tax=Herbidospora sp. NBRC 101105 TaxID=3032195 RepID=UPI0024A3F49F|nr:hypothetical protein [Herbidospora sp. NBRC 101105]GLX92954.1 hypothetical protein Hesp01_09040 [Herbidospora sp. NBRC 101105]
MPERVRELMADNVLRHRLALDFPSGLTTWSSKTGTTLNPRHEVDVAQPLTVRSTRSRR